MGSRRRRNIQKRYANAMDALYDALGSHVTIYYKTGNKLGNSYAWDPINNETLDPNTPSDGNVFQDEILSVTVKANISWDGASDKFIPNQLPGGKIDKTDVLLTFKLKDVLLDPNDTSGNTYLDQLVKIDIDGQIVKGKTTPFKYAPAGLLYNCYIKCYLDKSEA